MENPFIVPRLGHTAGGNHNVQKKSREMIWIFIVKDPNFAQSKTFSSQESLYVDLQFQN